eukprot:TRINITY_DN33568_c0_g1_i1.p1 TRINITY_DN33568_c0_g1~~TRINITY_DN33568_c0_g1_i1.p1  ORF type:complete len:359 (-),score=47.31 TRINITY_DN33568_c0_g1_i1:321-1397(-)
MATAVAPAAAPPMGTPEAHSSMALVPSTRGETKLSDALLQSLAVGKVYRDHKGGVTGLDFTQDGLHLVTCGEDNAVYVYSAETAGRGRHLRCEKYGARHLRFMHNDRDCAVAASRCSTDNVLKYWDFQENKYLRLFRSHAARVRSVSPHPYEDIFLSGSADKTVLLWDLRVDKPTAKINGEGPTVASFDQQGLVFAACVGQPRLHLFDTRNYAKGEFISFDLSVHLKGDTLTHSVQFSPCGKYLLVRTRSQLLLVDAFDGELIVEYPVAGTGEFPPATDDYMPPTPSFSPDSQYVMSGVQGGDVCIWSTSNARLVQRLEGHTATAGYAQFSPTHALAVTAAETLAWWIPDSRRVASGA